MSTKKYIIFHEFFLILSLLLLFLYGAWIVNKNTFREEATATLTSQIRETSYMIGQVFIKDKDYSNLSTADIEDRKISNKVINERFNIFYKPSNNPDTYTIAISKLSGDVCKGFLENISSDIKKDGLFSQVIINGQEYSESSKCNKESNFLTIVSNTKGA